MCKFDYSLLRGKIREVFKTEGAFAEAMNISHTTLSAKLNNQIQFTQLEMQKACELLDIAIEFLPVYFFTPKVKEA